jgi:hypothetical protein
MSVAETAPSAELTMVERNVKGKRRREVETPA